MKIYISIFSISTLLSFCCCTDFLEVKPDIKMVIPKSLEDAKLLLNDYATMNTGYPIYGEWSADEYYITDETFDARLDFDQRNTYMWMDVIYDDATQWQKPFKAVFNANQIIDIITKGVVDKNTLEAKKPIGCGIFLSGICFPAIGGSFCTCLSG
ncbi:hypothetical protein ACFX5U_15535 [Sphingobacterium sp. SG20118]|uniref:hypothetical protein n=1 Tax=Sphingobacterium sp. SG20118 TaxID=3367156 RepID=UPI0037DFC8B1